MNSTGCEKDAGQATARENSPNLGQTFELKGTLFSPVAATLLFGVVRPILEEEGGDNLLLLLLLSLDLNRGGSEETAAASSSSPAAALSTSARPRIRRFSAVWKDW